MNNKHNDALAEVLRLAGEATPDTPRDRPAKNYPGGCDCHQCGSIFIGAESDDLCGRCYAHNVFETAAVNFLRAHGPALATALRLRERCEGLEEQWRHEAIGDADETWGCAHESCADDLARVLEEGE